jgi:hypothetical protein
MGVEHTGTCFRGFAVKTTTSSESLPLSEEAVRVFRAAGRSSGFRARRDEESIGVGMGLSVASDVKEVDLGGVCSCRTRLLPKFFGLPETNEGAEAVRAAVDLTGEDLAGMISISGLDSRL